VTQEFPSSPIPLLVCVTSKWQVIKKEMAQMQDAQKDRNLKILVVVFVPHAITRFLLNKVVYYISVVTFGSTVSVL